MELRIDNELREVTGPEELERLLAEPRASDFAEVWLSGSDGWPVICALLNAEAAWLMYLRFKGDAGFSTRNPTYEGPVEAMIEYRLANGQHDEYPASWNVSRAEAIRALAYFLNEEKMAPWLKWSQG